ncbi:MAG: hypothetical protein ACOC7T_01190 [Planctomycetota bacterium]
MRIVALGVLIACAAASAGPGERPVVGAIRWDAWTGGATTELMERTLGPAKYHHRLPWFAEVVGENEVRIDGGRQAVMDREIGFAAGAGLDYWAFLLYREGRSNSDALKQYLASDKRERIDFCFILHNMLGVEAPRWPAERERAVALLKEPDYQTVLGGRPLVYAFAGRDFPFARFEQFLAAAKEAGLDPYCVYMGWNPPLDWKKVSGRGFDAVSNYAMGSSQPEFEDLVAAVETKYWQRAAAAGAPYVPLVTTGWDKRPRQDHPVPWESDAPYHQQEVFPSMATPSEIASHLRGALSFVRSHREICRANAVVIYAWNEYDEGGWLSPTRGADGEPDTSRLDAVRKVLRLDRGGKAAGLSDPAPGH